MKLAEVGGCGGGGDAPDATDPLDDDGGRSEAAADASLESAKDRGVKVSPIALEERTIVMEELKGGGLGKGCDERTTAVIYFSRIARFYSLIPFKFLLMFSA